MKANELQIGDWVYLNYWDGKYTQQIHGINYYSWRGEGYSDWVDTEIDDEASINNIEPVPLTAEILEKNGFKKEIDDMGDPYYSLKDYTFSLYYFFDANVISLYAGGHRVFLEKKIYVHELQHALRLCGLADIADNFRID